MLRCAQRFTSGLRAAVPLIWLIAVTSYRRITFGTYGWQVQILSPRPSHKGPVAGRRLQRRGSQHAARANEFLAVLFAVEFGAQT
jgi:hypothetical protein